MLKMRPKKLLLVLITISCLFISSLPILTALQSLTPITSYGRIVQKVILTSSASPSPSLLGQQVTFKGYCTDGQGAPLAQQPVLLRYSRDLNNWYNLTAVTDSNGNYSVKWTPSYSGQYSVKTTTANVGVEIEQIVANSIVSSLADLRKAITIGGVVFVTGGTYYIDSSIYLSRNLILIGSGQKTVISVTSSRDLSIFLGINVSNVQIARFTLNGNRSPSNSSGNPGILFKNSSNVAIDSVKIVNLDREAFGLTSSNTIIITNSMVQNVWNGVIIRDSSNVLIKDNLFNWMAGDGIYVSTTSLGIGSKNVTLEGNTLTNVGDTGIDVSTPYSARSEDIKIYNNTYVGFNTLSPTLDPNGIGITISKCSGAIVIGNEILFPKGGILIGNAIVNATISQNTVSGFSNYGVWVVTPTNLSDNEISNGTAAGIRINPSAGNFDIVGNIVSNTSIAIEWIGSAPGVLILNNTILNPRIYGIYDGGAQNSYWTSGTSIIGNSIIDNRANHLMQYGIYQGNAAVTWTIGNNMISGTLIKPMYLASKTNIIY